MAFFDEIGKTLADKSREAAKKAKDVAEILQLKAQISTEKSKTKELYASIGVLYFKKHRDDENDEYQMFFPEIEKTLAHIAELEERVKKLEKAGTCPVCGASVGKNDAFCAKCRELGYEIYEMDLITAGEEFYATMRRSTNGGGENSPKLAGEDDFYELFFASLEQDK